jgi:hypothetical protein
MWKRLCDTKTLYVALGIILSSFGAAMQGVVDWETATQTIVTSILALLVRDGVAKGSKTQ